MDHIPEHQTVFIQNLIHDIEHRLLPEADDQFSRCQNYRIFRAYFNVHRQSAFQLPTSFIPISTPI